MNTSAERIVSKFGGPRAVAGLLGLDVSTVHRWGYPRERGGSDGQIPTRHQRALLSAARERGIDLTPADFFDPPPDPAAAQPADAAA